MLLCDFVTLSNFVLCQQADRDVEIYLPVVTEELPTSPGA